MQRQILRLKDVVELVGLSKTTIWRRMRAGEFPPALRLGGPSTRAVGWKMTDVEAWVSTRGEPCVRMLPENAPHFPDSTTIGETRSADADRLVLI